MPMQGMAGLMQAGQPAQAAPQQILPQGAPQQPGQPNGQQAFMMIVADIQKLIAQGMQPQQAILTVAQKYQIDPQQLVGALQQMGAMPGQPQMPGGMT